MKGKGDEGKGTLSRVVEEAYAGEKIERVEEARRLVRNAFCRTVCLIHHLPHPDDFAWNLVSLPIGLKNTLKAAQGSSERGLFGCKVTPWPVKKKEGIVKITYTFLNENKVPKEVMQWCVEAMQDWTEATGGFITFVKYNATEGTNKKSSDKPPKKIGLTFKLEDMGHSKLGEACHMGTRANGCPRRDQGVPEISFCEMESENTLKLTSNIKDITPETFCVTVKHEIGHVLGLKHEFGGAMVQKEWADKSAQVNYEEALSTKGFDLASIMNYDFFMAFRKSPKNKKLKAALNKRTDLQMWISPDVGGVAKDLFGDKGMYLLAGFYYVSVTDAITVMKGHGQTDEKIKAFLTTAQTTYKASYDKRPDQRWVITPEEIA